MEPATAGAFPDENATYAGVCVGVGGYRPWWLRASAPSGTRRALACRNHPNAHGSDAEDITANEARLSDGPRSPHSYWPEAGPGRTDRWATEARKPAAARHGLGLW
jgi:hypothetical protein